jgi:HlyD family secretion protein
VDADLKAGMSCKAEIIVEEYEDVVYVPVQAVLRVEGEPTVFVCAGGSYVPREVEIGLDNNRMVHVIRGLDEGEVVLTTPPLESAALPPTHSDKGGAAKKTASL